MGYTKIVLMDMINELGENKVKTILSKFSCPQNKDVESFLHHKAIEFAKQNIASTHLVFAPYQDKPVLIGYFSISPKTIIVPKKTLSKTLQKRVKKFGSYIQENKGYMISAPLIAQLGKNFYNGYNSLIDGDELLKIACNTVSEVQLVIGGKIVYLECEDKERLISFYESNGFVNFGKRELDKDEMGLDGKYLIQLLKYSNDFKKSGKSCPHFSE